MTERKKNKCIFHFVADEAFKIKGNVSEFFPVIIQNHFQLQKLSSAMQYRQCFRNVNCYFPSSRKTKKQPPESYRRVFSYGLHTQLPQKQDICSLYIAWHLPF